MAFGCFVGVPRQIEKDDTFEGRIIKKDTIAHVVELALARKSVLYLDPKYSTPPAGLRELTDIPRSKPSNRPY